MRVRPTAALAAAADIATALASSAATYAARQPPSALAPTFPAALSSAAASAAFARRHSTSVTSAAREDIAPSVMIQTHCIGVHTCVPEQFGNPGQSVALGQPHSRQGNAPLCHRIPTSASLAPEAIDSYHRVNASAATSLSGPSRGACVQSVRVVQ